MAQKFYAHPTNTFTWPNGAIGHRSGGAFDCLGPYAKVRNCPLAGTDNGSGKPLKLTCYAVGYPDTYFSVPASTRYKGKYIGGYFALGEENIEFRPYDRYKGMLPMKGDDE